MFSCSTEQKSFLELRLKGTCRHQGFTCAHIFTHTTPAWAHTPSVSQGNLCMCKDRGAFFSSVKARLLGFSPDNELIHIMNQIITTV